MRFNSLILVGLTIAASASAQLAVRGTVVSSVGNAPLDSVTVFSQYEADSAVTGANGAFELGIPASVQQTSRIVGLRLGVNAQGIRLAAPVGARAEVMNVAGRVLASFDAGRLATVRLGFMAAGNYVVRVTHGTASQALSLSWSGGDMHAWLVPASADLQLSGLARSAAGTDTTVTFYRRGFFPKDTVIGSMASDLVIRLTPFTTSQSCIVNDSQITPNISADCHLPRGTYHLQGLTSVDSGATLSMDPGTIIKGAVGATGERILSALFVRPRARIYAIGTVNQPIVMTAGTANPQPGDWGGLILLGRAQENFRGTPIIEGSTDLTYGGEENADNSGELRYMQINFAGYIIGLNNELNCLTTGGVGSGTKISYIQCYRGLDDAFEFFGGAVNARHLVSTATDDDMFDFETGHIGNIQFGFGTAGASNADANGVEADNNTAANQNNLPWTRPTVANLTIVGNNGLYGANRSLDGVRLRRGFGGHLANILVTGGFQRGVTVGGNTSFRFVLNDSLTMAGLLIDNVTSRLYTTNAVLAGLDTVVVGMDSVTVLSNVATKVRSWYAADSATMSSIVHGVTAASPVPLVSAQQLRDLAAPTPAGLWPANYIGAFEPGGRDWTAGWTLPHPAP